MTDGYIIEAALARGFVPTNDEATVFTCTEEQLLAFAREPLAEIERLREALRETYEVYARSEGIPQPMTAAEGYLLHLVKEMANTAQAALGEGK